VSFTDDAGRVFDGTTPVTLTLPVGVYQWRVAREGFVTDSSREGLDVTGMAGDTFTVRLTPSGDRATRLERARAAFARNCGEAIPLLESIERPGELNSALGTEWLGVQLQLGQCYKRQRDWERAIATFAELTRVANQWTAKYHLGETYCELGTAEDTRRGRQHLRELQGPFLGQVAADRKEPIVALARYAEAICGYHEYKRQAQPERWNDLRQSVIGSLEEFVAAAETLDRRGVPADLRGALSQALETARARRAELQR
jgi:hypothetical protein